MKDADLEVMLARLIDLAMAERLKALAWPHPVAYSLRDAATAVGVSESHLRREVHAGHLTARMVGRRYFVGHNDLQSWFNALPQADTYRTSYRGLRSQY